MANAASRQVDLKARVVLLGASNLTRGISTVIETARLILGRPLEVFAALGYGRSYGMRSRVFVRSLPGIVECGLWDALAERETALPTCALITDVGNDILYGVGPVQIIEWVQWCIDRLRDCNARIVVTQLPMESISGLPRWKYHVVRAALFPGCEVSYEQAMARAVELDGRLRELVASEGVRSIEMDRVWYGFDPIHIRMRFWPRAWGKIVSGWSDGEPPAAAAGSLRRWILLRKATPQRWWLMGRPRERSQPAARLPGGTTVSLF